MAPKSPFRMLFRTWSSSSAGTNSRLGFKSGGQYQRDIDLLAFAENFENHIDLNNRDPTFFISTTDDPIRALKYAIDLFIRGKEDIHISIIRSNGYLYAEELATALEFDKPCLFRTEFLFLWEIEPAEILHVVSLEDLLGNGLLEKFKVLDPGMWEDEDNGLPQLGEIRDKICENNMEAWQKRNRNTWPERSGRYVANIAKCFGAGAPHRAIASLIWEHGTHFWPENYEDDGLDYRVRGEIQKVLDKNARSSWYDEWCGELVDV